MSGEKKSVKTVNIGDGDLFEGRSGETKVCFKKRFQDINFKSCPPTEVVFQLLEVVLNIRFSLFPWRLVASNFETFLNVFNLNKEFLIAVVYCVTMF